MAERCLMTQKQISEFEGEKLNVTMNTLFRLSNTVQLIIDLVEFKTNNDGRKQWDQSL